MDPARRKGPASAAPGAEKSAREPAAPPTREPEPDAHPPAPRPPAGRRVQLPRRVRAASARGAVDRVRSADFPIVMRGYDRTAVDSYVAEVAQLVAELEATQLPESVVQRASTRSATRRAGS